jgi:hypothetical protein
MDGIIYLEDNNTKKKYVQIDLEKYGDLWPDFLDIIIANARKNDKKIPFKDVPESHKEVVRNRMAEFDKNPEIGLDYDEVMTELKSE